MKPSSEVSENTFSTKIKENKSINDDLVRLIIQSLETLGFNNAANTLQNEAGVMLELPTVTKFRNLVLDGQWDQSEELLSFLNIPTKDNSIVKFLLRKQKFMELLEKNLINEALKVLRNELQPIVNSTQTRTLHKLSSLIMCNSIEDIKAKEDWLGIEGGSRKVVLEQVRQHIPSSVMIPENRLGYLLDQALEYQKSKCLYHYSSDEQISLLEDHTCNRTDFPGSASHVFEEHSDEVWYVCFSHNGKMLASASKDATAIIWDTINFKPVHVLAGHKEAISHCTWSPNDTKLLTASHDKTLKLWNVENGQHEQTFFKHNEAVSSCSWLPNGQKFISGSVDKFIYLWNLKGDVLYKWENIRCHDLAVSYDGNLMYAISDKKLMMFSLKNLNNIYPTATPTLPVVDGNVTSINSTADNSNFVAPPVFTNNVHNAYPNNVSNNVSTNLHNDLNNHTHTMEAEESNSLAPLLETFMEDHPITSLFLCEDKRYALVTLATQEIHLWDLEEKKIVKRYIGHKQGRFIIRSCFGGVKKGFVLSGSEDSRIYVWHRERGDLLEYLSGHSGCVSCVSWNPKFNMFASASDDHTI
ncbi:hypothetical protein HK099_007235, partial [Clydaea vesicula]